MILTNVSSRRWGQNAALCAFGGFLPTLETMDATPDSELLNGYSVGPRKVAAFRAHIEALRPILEQCENIAREIADTSDPPLARRDE